ncbi:MAG: HEPN domain-containing protein [Anaerolineae bacterium]
MAVEAKLAPVIINGVVLEPKSELHRKKLEALRVFVEKLLHSRAKDAIVKVILFGSALDGDVWEESDIDVLVFGKRPLKAVEEACFDAAFETMLAMSESVEPLVRTANDFFTPESYFVYTTIKEGREIYSMDEEALKRKEVETLYTLAAKYLGEAKRRYDPSDEGSRRVTIDAAYKAAELYARAMLRLKTNRLPKTHSGMVTLFSDVYVKTGLVSHHLGRAFGRTLKYRNDARYDGDADITPPMVDEVLNFATELQSTLEGMLAKGGKNEEKDHPGP